MGFENKLLFFFRWNILQLFNITNFSNFLIKLAIFNILNFFVILKVSLASRANEPTLEFANRLLHNFRCNAMIFKILISRILYFDKISSDIFCHSVFSASGVRKPDLGFDNQLL